VLLLVHCSGLQGGDEDGGSALICVMGLVSVILAKHLKDPKIVRIGLMDYEANDLELEYFPAGPGGVEALPPFLSWFPLPDHKSKAGKRRGKKRGGLMSKSLLGERKIRRKGTRVRAEISVSELVKFVHKKLPQKARFPLNPALEEAKKLETDILTHVSALNISLALAETEEKFSEPLKKMREEMWGRGQGNSLAVAVAGAEALFKDSVPDESSEGKTAAVASEFAIETQKCVGES